MCNFATIGRIDVFTILLLSRVSPALNDFQPHPDTSSHISQLILIQLRNNTGHIFPIREQGYLGTFYLC